MAAPVNVALLGLGVVGSGVARALLEKGEVYARRLGRPLRLRRVLVRDLQRQRPLPLDPSLLTDQADLVLDDDEVHIVVEVMGGERPALDYIRRALERGRYVVTANKEVMAKHGPDLLALAHRRGVDILYEASVGAGIPIISPLKRDLSANEIRGLRAIINGTTNYILTRMDREGMDFATALAQAQELGYAEPDPSNDVEGHDAVYKLAILASLAFHTYVPPEAIYREGIARLQGRDFRYARELGYCIKLLAIARRSSDDGGEAVEARVHPVLLSQDELLAKVDGVLNAIEVEGDLLGRVVFQGPGAGAAPTASAVIADILDAAQALTHGRPPAPWQGAQSLPLRPMSELRCRYYIRMEVADRPGVLAQIARCFGDHQVSIASVIQKETNEAAQTAEIVIMTHSAREADVRATMADLERLEVVCNVGNFLRVEG
ncbi:MAG: homoserine dehydrogenase [Dehalococcoidia bacterium]|nr:homoserine dehydrogenase [Dehalococcoidia bacterium]MDW8009811.1 homoserine dehydrogenase [Chloroflexota bacterium]